MRKTFEIPLDIPDVTIQTVGLFAIIEAKR
jgi:hypothetical protein